MLILARGILNCIPTSKHANSRIHFLLSFAFILTISSTLLNPVFGQVDCDDVSTPGCYNNLNIAIDGECHAYANVSALISNHNPALSYTVTFTDESGETTTDNDLGSFLGQTLTFEVQDECGNGCWGNITVEDKTGAILNGCEDVTLTCAEYEMGTSAVDHKPEFHPNCDMPEAVFSFEDDTLSIMCQNGFASSILRTWTVLSADGDFIAQCEQNINVEIQGIDQVVFPTDITLDYTQNSSCDIFSDENLHPDNLGYPTGILCPNFNWFFQDTDFDICGASRKILRKWTVIDWCSGEIAKGEHVIKVVDDEPPIKVCPPDTLKFPALYGCTAKINLDPFDLDHGVGALQALVECSDFDIFVEFLPAEVGTAQPAEDGMYSSVGVVKEDNGTYTLPMLPEGLAWIRYRFIDACNNGSPLTNAGTDDSGSCYFEVQVVDGSAPTAICEGLTNVYLDEYGYATLNAQDIDNHSKDQCGNVVEYEIKRQGHCEGHADDEVYGPSVHFCCDDVGKEIWVFLKVYDDMGNSSICESRVIVNAGTFGGGNDIKITCPDDVYLDCTDDYLYHNFPDVEVTSVAHGDCESSEPGQFTTKVSFDDSNIIGCGTGFIIRTITVTFTDGTIKSCSHKIFIDSADPLDPSDIFVKDEIQLAACNSTGNSLDPNVIGGAPEINNSSPCTSTTIDYDDEIIPGTGTYCQIVQRTWTITDYCALTGPEEYTFVQIIRLSDGIAPSFLNCSNAMYTVPLDNCDMQVMYTASVKDNCTPDDLINITWKMDVASDGFTGNDLSGSGATFMEVLNIGDHTLTYTATDACGNEKTCEIVIMVKGGSGSGPQAICLTEIEWTLDFNGEAEIWASDFNFASSGGCLGNGGSLTYSFTDPTFSFTPVTYFTCDNIPNGITADIPVQIWVIDEGGNYSTCISILKLTDVIDVCPNQVGGPMIYGRISSEDGQPASNIEVILEDMTMNQMNYGMSQEEGDYMFENMNFNSDYMVKPENDENHLLGVSTLDIVKIQQHVLNINKLDSPYKLIAADVNKSGSISGVDLIQIRKLILGLYDKFPSNQSWTFVKEDFTFGDPENPWNYIEESYIQNLTDEESENNFTAIKIGDVNGNAFSNLIGESTDTRSAFALIVDEIQYAAGEEVRIPVYSNQFDEVYGLQFSLESKSLNFEAIESGKLPIKEYNYSADYNQLNVTWNDVAPISIDDSPLFVIIASANKKGSIGKDLRINDELIANEIYQGGSLQTKTLLLQAGENGIYTNELGQNRPNPFDANSIISFTLSEAQNASIIFYDPTGKELKRISGDYPIGKSSVTISSEWFTSSGVIYYKLEAGDYAAIRKMILVK